MDVLFQMRYGSLLDSNKQPSDSLRAEATPVFSSLQYCCSLLFCLLFLPDLLWGLQERLYIFECHSAICYRRISYYTAYER